MTSKKEKLSPYWRRMTSRAEEILSEKIALLSEFAAQAGGGKLSAWQQQSKAVYGSILKRMKEGGLNGKLWALNTIARHDPKLIFTYRYFAGREL